MSTQARTSRSFISPQQQALYARSRQFQQLTLIGFLLFIGSIPLIAWNEPRSLEAHLDLDRLKDSVVKIEASPIKDENEGKLVYLTGEATPNGVITDEDLGENATVSGISKLERTAEMYQWVEHTQTQTKCDGATNRRNEYYGNCKESTRYEYTKEWRSELIDSSKFNFKAGHENPTAFDVVSKTSYVPQLSVGDFVISDINEIDKLSNETATQGHITDAEYGNGPIQNLTLPYPDDPNWYPDDCSLSPDDCDIGHIRVSFKAYTTGAVTILANQTGDTFGPYEDSSDDDESIYRVEAGIVPLEDMIRLELDIAGIVGITVAGVLAMMIGMGMIIYVQPMHRLFQIIPFDWYHDKVSRPDSKLLRYVTIFILSGVMTAAISTTMIGAVWLKYNPAIFGVGITLVLLVGSYAFYVMKVHKSKNGGRAAEKCPTDEEEDDNV